MVIRFRVKAERSVAGGFIGYANVARMSGYIRRDQNQENSLKLVESGGTAGGFAGRTSFAYLADVKLDSTVVDALFVVLDQLVGHCIWIRSRIPTCCILILEL